MVAVEMLRNGFILGKGLGASLQGIIQPVSLLKSTIAYVKRSRRMKQREWVLPKPVPLLFRLFVRPDTQKLPSTTSHGSVVGPDKELLERFEKLFEDVNMVESGEGSSKADVQLVGPSAKINNWEATPLPTRKEFW